MTRHWGWLAPQQARLVTVPLWQCGDPWRRTHGILCTDCGCGGPRGPAWPSHLGLTTSSQHCFSQPCEWSVLTSLGLCLLVCTTGALRSCVPAPGPRGDGRRWHGGRHRVPRAPSAGQAAAGAPPAGAGAAWGPRASPAPVPPVWPGCTGRSPWSSWENAEAFG